MSNQTEVKTVIFVNNKVVVYRDVKGNLMFLNGPCDTDRYVRQTRWNDYSYIARDQAIPRAAQAEIEARIKTVRFDLEKWEWVMDYPETWLQVNQMWKSDKDYSYHERQQTIRVKCPEGEKPFWYWQENMLAEPSLLTSYHCHKYGIHDNAITEEVTASETEKDRRHKASIETEKDRRHKASRERGVEKEA